TQHIVAEAAAAAGIPVPGRYLEVTGSTNADLAAMAAAGAPAWTVMVAGHQESGRGRLGRAWESKPGQSLLVSVLLRPSLRPEDAPLLSVAAAVAVVETARTAGITEARAKWPNDVMVGDRKLAGILPEASVTGGALDHLVIGVGLNVSQGSTDFPEVIRESATSVALERGSPDPADVLPQLLIGLRRWLEPDDGLRDRVLSRYRELCSTLGRRVRATVSLGREVEGVAVGIGPRGELIVETDRATETVGFGEITHLDQGLPGPSPEG
ncbi:MAG TPA: biotin--[acetyl-CoA-carboxylase] ligase, partial [Actinomycetota bacterium]|nr:biotin--[acetyl-CoA-carboxylase] ligase [Actinomycetota bacterium]